MVLEAAENVDSFLSYVFQIPVGPIENKNKQMREKERDHILGGWKYVSNQESYLVQFKLSNFNHT